MRTDTTQAVTYYYQQDHEGSVTHLTNGSGAVVETYQYDAFGAPNTVSAWGNPFMFTGRRYQPALGVYEYRARAYQPRLGRFTSEDPSLYDAGDYNLFRYCHNDPLDLTDPMGLENAPGQFWAPTPERMEAGNGQWALAKWGDSSNNLQSSFAQFASRQGLTIGQMQGRRNGGNFFSRLLRSLFGHRDNIRATRTITREGYLRIDTDGRGPAHGDPHHEPETSYKPQGRSLNADVDNYVAVPTAAQGLGVRAGDPASARVYGRTVSGIVGDFGGTGYGEMSVHMVRDAGIGIHIDPVEGPVPNTRGGINPPVTITISPSAAPSE
jgi:RHS repeat-associated protein